MPAIEGASSSGPQVNNNAFPSALLSPGEALAGPQAAHGGSIIELVAPRISSVVALTPTSIRVAFSEPMTDDSALDLISNYVISVVSGGAAAVIVGSATPEAVANPTYVDLTTTEMTDGGDYRLTVSNVKDTSLNVIDPAYNSDDFAGLGSLPQLTSVAALTSKRVRLQFSEPMLKNAALRAAANYVLLPQTVGAAQIYYSEVVLPDVVAPTFIDILTSEMTDGATYEATVLSPGPTDLANNIVDPSHQTATFAGVGDAPFVQEVIAVSKNRADVVFNEPMADNADLRDPSKYTWDNGLTTISVLSVDVNTVSLVTSDQTPGVLYELTVAP